MGIKVWCLLVVVISAMVEVPCKSRTLKVIIQRKREKAGLRMRVSGPGKKAEGVVYLVSSIVSTQWCPYSWSLAVATQRKC